MIKIIILLTSLLLTAIAAPAFAHEPEYSKECVKAGEKITDMNSRNIFLESCLKKIDMTEFQMAEKAEQCYQNTVNMKLTGSKKDEYFVHCYYEDDAHPNPNQTPHPKM